MKDKKASRLPAEPTSTGIGSLPHHNVDAALGFSFQCSLPFLPQIPIRNGWEFMIAQALEGMPGLQVEKDGTPFLDLNVWVGRSRAFNDRLLAAYDGTAKTSAFEWFEPSAAASSCWQPFLWELQERKVKWAKIQLAGPLTAQWSLRLRDGTVPPEDKYPEIPAQIYRLVLARAIGMSRRLQEQGVQPVFYLDEPGLYGFIPTNPRHVMGMQELKLMVQALRKDGVLVGMHCCSNTEWAQVLQMGLDIVSIDTHLSLASLLQHADPLEKFIKDGGRLSLGVIPTSREPGALQRLNARDLFGELMDIFAKHWSDRQSLVQKVLKEAIYTPACGLALHTPTDAEAILAMLLDLQQFCATSL